MEHIVTVGVPNKDKNISFHLKLRYKEECVYKLNEAL